MADIQEKEIEVPVYKKHYSRGQEVTVIFRESQGFIALFFGYILPFILVLLTLIIAVSVTADELTGGLLALAILVPYYTALYFFRHYLKNVFKFELEENY